MKHGHVVQIIAESIEYEKERGALTALTKNHFPPNASMEAHCFAFKVTTKDGTDGTSETEPVSHLFVAMVETDRVEWVEAITRLEALSPHLLRIWERNKEILSCYALRKTSLTFHKGTAHRRASASSNPTGELRCTNDEQNTNKTKDKAKMKQNGKTNTPVALSRDIPLLIAGRHGDENIYSAESCTKAFADPEQTLDEIMQGDKIVGFYMKDENTGQDLRLEGTITDDNLSGKTSCTIAVEEGVFGPDGERLDKKHYVVPTSKIDLRHSSGRFLSRHHFAVFCDSHDKVRPPHTIQIAAFPITVNNFSTGSETCILKTAPM